MKNSSKAKSEAGGKASCKQEERHETGVKRVNKIIKTNIKEVVSKKRHRRLGCLINSFENLQLGEKKRSFLLQPFPASSGSF